MEKTERLVQDQYFGRLNDPSASSYVKGLCGEEMEFYLVIRDGVITDIRYYTEGCDGTRSCGAAAAALALNRPLEEALTISAGEVIGELAPLPEEHKHCAILAVITLYKALAEYLLKD